MNKIYNIKILVLLLVISCCCSLLELSVIRCKGSYVNQQGVSVPASFLSKGRLEVIESNNEGTTDFLACDIFPIPFQRTESMYLFDSPQNSKFELQYGCSLLLNRDNGIFDNLPYEWVKGENMRKELFNFLNGGQGTGVDKNILKFSAITNSVSNPYDMFTCGMNSLLKFNITGLFLEAVDESESTLNLGASVVIAKQNVANNWLLTSKNPKIPQKIDAENMEAKSINCHIDELIGFSLSTNMPICISNKIYETGCVDGRIRKNKVSNEISISAPIFSKNKPYNDKISLNDVQNKMKSVKPAWEIFNPQTFLTMSMAEKRAVLRASKVFNLPRPREGAEVIDAMLLDLADDAVRREVLRLRKEETKFNNNNNNNNIFYSNTINTNGITDRQVILQQIGDALKNGDLALADSLKEKFRALSMLRADPTQAPGSYDRYMDQDDWYLEQRRKAMAPKKKP